MFHTRGLALVMAGAVCGFLQASPVTAQGSDPERLEAFMEVTGFDVAMDSIALAAGDAPLMLGMSASDFGTSWTQLADEVFDTELMNDMAVEILSATLSDDLLTHAAEFYASDLGRRLVEVENASHLADDDVKQAQGTDIVARGLETGDLRIEILQDLNTAVDSSGTAVRAVQEIQVRFLMAASNSGVLEQVLDETALRAALKENEAALRVDLQTSALANAAFTYRDIPEDDLQAYLEALEHPDMQQVYELMNAVQYEVMANRFELLGARMAELHPGEEL
ncbi:MAG: DUF2059 domain-containing protein [Pseudomonadota bacterium]